MLDQFLPPANEVWGKVMFLHLSVSHFVRGGYLPYCILGYTHPQADTDVASPPPHPPVTTGYGQQAGSMHPTGMHTCH